MWRQGQTHQPYTLSFLGTWDTGTVLKDIYLRRQGQTHQPYTLSFLGTWGHGDSSLGYIPTEIGTDKSPIYTLISGDVGTRGQLPRIYTYGDRDIKYHPYTLSFLGTWGQYSWIYILNFKRNPTILNLSWVCFLFG